MNNTTNKQLRQPVYDIMKCFAIYLVIWGHCIGELSPNNVADLFMYRVIYSFHMPLFMMISGYFACSSMKMTPITFFKKKFRQLLYPCIIIGGLVWLYAESLHSFHYQRNDFSITALFIDYYWFADFWFLKSCFVCYCLAYIGVRSKLKKKYWMLFTLLISQGIAPFFVSFMYPCFLIGMELRNNDDFKYKIFRFRWYIISLYVIMLLFWTTETWNKSHGIPNGLLNAGIDVWINIIYYRLFRLIIGVVGALSVYTIFMGIFNQERNNIITKTLGEWGQYTLEVYILQAILLEKIIAQYVKFDNVSPFAYNFVITPIISVIILIVLIYVTKWIYKMPKLGSILFGKNVKTTS